MTPFPDSYEQLGFRARHKKSHTFVANQIKFNFLGFVFVKMRLDQGLHDIFVTIWELEVVPCIQPWFELPQPFLSLAVNTNLQTR